MYILGSTRIEVPQAVKQLMPICYSELRKNGRGLGLQREKSNSHGDEKQMFDKQMCAGHKETLKHREDVWSPNPDEFP